MKTQTLTKKVFKGTALDYQNYYPYAYPKTGEEASKVRLKFDFIFTKNKKWFYISSSNDAALFTAKGYELHKPVEQRNEQWKVVDAITGEIIKENKTKEK